MTLFWMILVANTLTMIVTIIEVIRRPLVSSLLIAITAVSAFTAALHQITSAYAGPFALPLTVVLVCLLVFRMQGAGRRDDIRRPFPGCASISVDRLVNRRRSPVKR